VFSPLKPKKIIMKQRLFEIIIGLSIAAIIAAQGFFYKNLLDVQRSVYQEIGTIQQSLHQEMGTIQQSLHQDMGTIQQSLHQDMGTIQGNMGMIGISQTEISKRIDRIVGVIPEIGIQVAFEELNKPIRFAVLVSKTVKQVDGQWAGLLHIVDNEGKKKYSYLMPLANENDKIPFFALRGMASEKEENAFSFNNIKSCSDKVRKPIVTPSNIDCSSSFIFREANAEKFMFSMGLLNAKPVKEGKLGSAVTTPNLLFMEINKNASSYNWSEIIK